MNTLVRVLVVDDSAYNRRTITKILEDIPGVEVVSYACNGEEGLRKVFDLKPDLITLDFVITSYSIHYTKLYENFSNSGSIGQCFFGYCQWWRLDASSGGGKNHPFRWKRRGS